MGPEVGPSLWKVKIFIPMHEYITSEKEKKNFKKEKKEGNLHGGARSSSQKNINWQASHARVAGLEDF